jgi:ribosome-associated protein
LTGRVRNGGFGTGAKGEPPIPKRTSKGPARAEILGLVTRSLDDDKAQDVLVIDLAGKTTIADHMVIATGTSARQVGAMADHLSEKLKASGRRTLSVEGMPQCDWVLIDAGDVVVHLFRPETRTFYALEKMWGAGAPPLVAAERREAGAVA